MENLTVRLLLKRDAKVNDKDMFRSTALHYASSGYGEGFEITRALLECGANTEHVQYDTDRDGVKIWTRQHRTTNVEVCRVEFRTYRG